MQQNIAKLILNIISIKHDYDNKITELITKVIVKGIDLETLNLYMSYVNDTWKVRAYLEAYAEGVDLTKYNPDLYSGDQLWWILQGIKDGVEVELYDSHKIPYEAMETIYNHLIEEKNKED